MVPEWRWESPVSGGLGVTGGVRKEVAWSMRCPDRLRVHGGKRLLWRKEPESRDWVM